MEENYFHAVVEAYKGLAERIREQTGYTTDGLELMRESFERPSQSQGGTLPWLSTHLRPPLKGMSMTASWIS